MTGVACQSRVALFQRHCPAWNAAQATIRHTALKSAMPRH